MRAQWQLKTNMCAKFINVDPEDVEVAKLVPRATDQVVTVQPRAEDVEFSVSLAHIVMRHVEGLAAQMANLLPGMLTGLWRHG